MDAGVRLGREPAVVPLRLVLDRLQHVVDERANAGAQLGVLGREREVHHASGLGVTIACRMSKTVRCGTWPHRRRGPLGGARARRRPARARRPRSRSVEAPPGRGRARGRRSPPRPSSRYGVGPESPGGTRTFRRSAERRAIASISRTSWIGSITVFESEPMQIADAALEDALGGQVAVAEVGLGRRARADRGARRRHQVELAVRRMRGVDDGRPPGQQADVGQELDRPAAVLGQALLDLAPLLAGVDVDDHPGLARRSGRSPRASRGSRRGRCAARGRPGPGCAAARASTRAQVGGDVRVAEPSLARASAGGPRRPARRRS